MMLKNAYGTAPAVPFSVNFLKPRVGTVSFDLLARFSENIILIVISAVSADSKGENPLVSNERILKGNPLKGFPFSCF